ncbi:hypothetical protein H5T87_05425 [bacterium]|nr:hypothetical protein [bacterium]
MRCELCGKEILPSQPSIAEGLDENGLPTEGSKFYHAWCQAQKIGGTFIQVKDGEVVVQVEKGEAKILPEEG